MMCMCQYINTAQSKPKKVNKKTNDDMDKFLEYMNGDIDTPSEEFKKFIDDEILVKRYLWIWREQKIQYAHCSNCDEEFETDYNIRHNEETRCPKCGRDVTARYAGYSRKFLYEQDNIIWYEKSHKDNNVIVAKAMHVVSSHQGSRRTTKYYLTALYKFEIGNCQMAKRSYYDKKIYIEDKVKTPEYGAKYYEIVENFNKCIKDTKFKYYNYNIGYKYYVLLDFYSKYPKIDTLSKVGLNNIIECKIYGRRTFNAINWSGDNLFEILKINKQDYKNIKAKNVTITPEFLRLLQEWRKSNIKLDINYLKKLSTIYSYEISDVIKISKLNNIKINKAFNFIEKQIKLVDDKNKKLFTWRSSVISMWMDYIRDCKKLNMNLNDKSIIFPKNLYKAHQNTITQIKVKENAKYDKKIKSRLKRLDKYYFEDEYFLIRPAASSKEMIEEGQHNHNCVGTYVERYANGDTVIMFVRSKLEKNKSLVTVEIKNNKIVQAREDRNMPASNEVMNFLDKFKVARLGGIRVNG